MEIIWGVFAAIFNEEGKLLLRRRRRESLQTPCTFEGEWELPGGTVEEENVKKTGNEKVFLQELVREVKEETGLSIEAPFVPPFHPTIYVNEKENKVDCAFLIPIGVVKEKPTSGENIYVCPKELKELTERPIGQRLVSGWGKRMCRMALMAFQYSPNLDYRNEAKKMLLEIYKA